MSFLVLLTLPSRRSSSLIPPCLLAGWGSWGLSLELLELLLLLGLVMVPPGYPVHPALPVLELVGHLALVGLLPGTLYRFVEFKDS